MERRLACRRALRRVRDDDEAARPAGHHAVLPGGAGMRAGRASMDRDSAAGPVRRYERAGAGAAADAQAVSLRPLLAAVLLCAGEAAAHAELVASSPADGASVASAPP